MLNPNRRQFLSLAGGVAAAGVIDTKNLFAATPSSTFDFLFLTDTHIEPELNAEQGCDMAFKKARTIPADFVIQGGDHVWDTTSVTKERAVQLFDMYGKTEQDLGLKVYHTVGNHDCFGIASKGKVDSGDTLYGKKMFEEHFGRAYYSFDHKGVHFLVLDSIHPIVDAPGGCRGLLEEDQLNWIAADLAKLSPKTPIIVSIHIPLVTAYDSYGRQPANNESSRGGLSVGNSNDVIKIFDNYNVIGVLQGHTHIWETVTWHGVPYVTGGAVSGNWWKGTRMGTPEGFTVVSVTEGRMSVRYETYGFKSVAPHNT
jgi:Icc protein